MGEYDPRRSSRARPSNQSQSQQSSATSSSSSGRAERASRSSAQRTVSSQLTTPTASTPSEPADDSITLNGDTAVRTLRSRVKDGDREQPASEDLPDMASSDNDIQDDDESVRCICGFDDYPGPPPRKEDAKHGAKDTIDLDPFLAAGVADDVAGFFLQCDVCKVWQHGGCVGILNADSSPDEYFCEECRKEYHKISVASNGQRYSQYLPLSRDSESTSRQTSLVAKDGAKSPRGKDKDSKQANSIPANNNQTSKRRSTMNSRVVYDEEEELRRAIEASKEDAPKDVQEAAARRTKRGRSDSNEKLESSKRQRTGSRSPSPNDDTAIQDDSDDMPMRNGSSKKSRAAAARTQREKVEKEERDRQRAEAANKRKGRADRRRAEDSDPSEEIPLAQRAAARAQAVASGILPPPPRNSSPPQPLADKPEKSSTLSKSKKSASRKKGRNQYTKDRDRSPGRSQSREVPDRSGGNARSRNNRSSHAKNQHDKTRELTWDDMNRWVAFCTDFTQKVEQEFVPERPDASSTDQQDKEKDKEGDRSNGAGGAQPKKNGSPPAAGSSLLAPPPQLPPTAPVNGGSPLKNCIEGPSEDPPRPDGEAGAVAPPSRPSPPQTEPGKVEKKEEEMNLVERLDFIKSKIKAWHATYGPDSLPSAA